MKVRKMVTTILCAGQQRRHRLKKQTFVLSGRRWGWDDLRGYHWTMYITMCKTDDQCKFDTWIWASKAGALGQPRGIERGGMWEVGSGWGNTCILLASSCWCMAKAVTILSSNYCPIKINKLFFFKVSFVWYEYYYSSFWEGNGTPLQYSCLENPMDGGAW